MSFISVCLLGTSINLVWSHVFLPKLIKNVYGHNISVICDNQSDMAPIYSAKCIICHKMDLGFWHIVFTIVLLIWNRDWPWHGNCEILFWTLDPRHEVSQTGWCHGLISQHHLVSQAGCFTDVSRTITFPDRRFPDNTFPRLDLSWISYTKECSCK